MSGINNANVMGNLGQNPELRYLPDGKPTTSFSVATSKMFKDKEGNKQERTEWHRLVLFGRNAEIAHEYLKKGSMAHISGELRTRKWTDKNGVERYTTEIVGHRLTLVGNAKNAASTSGSSMPESAPPADQSPPPEDSDDMDIPF